MEYRERAALTLFICRVSIVALAYALALRVTEGNAVGALATQVALNIILILRPPVKFMELRRSWANPLVSYLSLCTPDLRSEFESVFRGWERQGAAFLLMMTFLTYLNLKDSGTFAISIAVVHGVVLALLFLRVRYALRTANR